MSNDVVNVPTALWLESFVVWRCGVDWPMIEKYRSEHYSYEHYYSVRMPVTVAQKGSLCPLCLERLPYPACIVFDRSFQKIHVADHACGRVFYGIDFDHLSEYRQELHDTLIDVSPLPYELMNIVDSYFLPERLANE